jgi:O-antigen/teichoic acid export membrane protein
MLAVGAAGVPAILLLYGREYAGSIVPFLIMLPGVAALGGASVLASDLLTRKKPKYGLSMGYILLAFNVAFNIALIPLMGISGSALASTISYVAALVLWMIFYRRESHVPLKELAPRWADCVYVWSGSWAMAREALGWIFGRRKTAAPPSPEPADPSGKG